MPHKFQLVERSSSRGIIGRYTGSGTLDTAGRRLSIVAEEVHDRLWTAWISLEEIYKIGKEQGIDIQVLRTDNWTTHAHKLTILIDLI